TLRLLLNKDLPALKTLHSQFTLTGNLQKVNLSALTLKLNSQTVVGALQYNIKQNHIISVFNADTLYWPDANAPTNPNNDKAPTLAKPVTLDTLPPSNNKSGQFSVDSRIQIQHLLYNSLSLDNLSTQLHYDGHTVTLNPLVVTVLQGLYQGKVLWTPEGNKLQIGGTLSHLNLDTLQNYLGQKPSVTGLLDSQGTLNSEGDNILANLNGALFVDIKEGTWTHLNMANILSFLNAAGSNRIASSGDTFSSANGHFIIRNGIANNPDLKLVSPLLSIKGKGALDLRGRQLNYNLMLRPNEVVLEQVKGLSQWLEKDIPVTVKGPWSNPKIQVDQAALITTKVQDQLDNTVKTVRKLILIR
ncbi:MAG: AsmA-like C-terminal region-containing protein, partial [Gammaproteobacteria bacterium]|nr:AsmA-like C-terminal region-containing protein [Gammaproteobacteria bacterium]